MINPPMHQESQPLEVGDRDTATAVHQVADLIPYAPQEARLALAALLEVRGISDDVARHRGATDVFDLARQLLAEHPANRQVPVRLMTQPDSGWWRHLMIGLAHAVVMILVLALLAIANACLAAAGVWTATVVLGIILATVVVGGALQLNAWLAAIALGRSPLHALRAALWHGVRIGMGAVLALALALICAGLVLGVELRQVIAVAAIIALTTPLLLATGTLLLLGRRAETSAILAIMVGTVIAAFAIYPGTVAHLIIVGVGTFGATAAIGALAEREIRQREMNHDQLNLPSAGRVMHAVTPRVCYGILSVILIFAGQLPIWLDIGPTSPPIALGLGHMLGLGLLVLGQGAFDAATHNLWGVVVAIKHQLALAESDAVGARFATFIRIAMGRALLVQLAITAMISGGAALLLWIMPALAPTPVMSLALAVCLLSYAILGHAIFLCGVLNTLGSRWAVVRIMGAATVMIGFYSTLGAAWWGILGATLGLLIGGIALLGLALGELRGLLQAGDGTFYSAFS